MVSKKLLCLLVLTLPSCYFFRGKSNMVIPRISNVQTLQKQFPLTVEEIKERVRFSKSQAESDLEKFYAISDEQRTFDNTVRLFDHAVVRFSAATVPLSVLEMVSPEKEIRDAAHEAVLELTNFSVDHFSQNAKIYHGFKVLSEKLDLDLLTPEQKYSFEQNLIGFKQVGLHLPEETQILLKELKKKLTLHELHFDKNIAQSNRSIKVDKKDLMGMSEDFIATLSSTDDGRYVLGVDYPTYYQVMENCSNESVRKALWFEFMNRAYPDNADELNEVIAYRDQIAKILGYKSYAAYDLDGQMAHNPETAQKFINDLIVRAKIKAEKEFNLLRQNLPYGVTLTKDNTFKQWDVLYINNQYKKKHLEIDECEIAQYFPLESTISGLFDIYQHFFGLKFEQISIPKIWHEDVQALSVSKDGKFIGYILLDLFPRDNKYSHACEITISPTFQDSTGFYPALILVIANFPKSCNGKPALLKRSDVITFFHEFGHAIHAILGATELATNSGASVKRDFVEMPSQMLEEWMWQPEILRQISKHYTTGEPLPHDLIKKILEIKNFSSGADTLRQLFYASLSLAVFQDGAKKDVDTLVKDLYERIMSTTQYSPENHLYASFGHLMGYGAKYYGYMWSKVFALDLFDTIKQHAFSSEIGQKYVDSVIGKGGNDDPMNLIKNFLGREPRNDAFFKDLGI